MQVFIIIPVLVCFIYSAFLFSFFYSRFYVFPFRNIAKHFNENFRNRCTSHYYTYFVLLFLSFTFFFTIFPSSLFVIFRNIKTRMIGTDAQIFIITPLSFSPFPILFFLFLQFLHLFLPLS